MTVPLTAPQFWLRRLLFVLLIGALLAAVGLGTYVAIRNAWAWYHYRQAEQAITEYKFEEALAHLELCLGVWKRSAETSFLAARTARRGNEYEKAERYLRQSQDLGWVKEQLQLEWLLLRAQREGPLAVEPFLQERMRRDDPETNLILEALAQGYWSSQRWAATLNCLEKWLQLEPDNRRALHWRGRTRAQLHLDDEALADLRRVLELDPDNDDARQLLAELLLRHKADYQGAAEHFERLVERQPGKVPLQLGLARAYRGLHRREEARQKLDQILRAFPRDPQALAERARLAVDSDQCGEAEELFRRSLKENPSDADAIAEFIDVLRERNKPAEAKKWEQRLKRLKADKERLNQLTRLMAERPRDAALPLEAAQIMLRNRQEREAMGWFQLALQIDPTHRPTHQALAEFWEEKGEKDRAAYHREMAESR